MKNEKIFSKGGVYNFVVANDILLHSESTSFLTEVLTNFIKNSMKKSIRILDLACGGSPLIVSNAIASLQGVSFDYFGVDINPDQIEKAKQFKFPSNTEVELKVADAWDLSTFLTEKKFDIIFIGLNTHHAIPEELDFFVSSLKKILSPEGLFINHDIFRPEKYDYRRRPNFCSNESLKLIPSLCLPESESTKKSLTANEEDWRNIFITDISKYMQEKNADSEMIKSNNEHIRQRDYPLSLSEFKEILENNEFKVEVSNYSNSHPLSDYLKFVQAQLRA